MAEYTNSGQLGDVAKSYPEIKKRADFIRNRLIEFQKKCRDSGKFDDDLLKEMMAFIKYMAPFLAVDDNNLFEDSFIGHLKVMTLIAKEPLVNFCKLFSQLTNLLFDLCPKIDEKVTFFNRVLKHWQGLLERVPNQLKRTAFLSCGESFKKCTHCLARASSASVQHKLLDIMHEYFKTNSTQPSKWFDDLFKHSDIIKNEMIRYVDIDYDSFDQKQMLIYRFNTLLEHPTIFTESIEIITIGKEIITFSGDDGFFYFNFNSKSIEFWLPFRGEKLMATIQAMNIEWIQIVNHSTCFAVELIFKLYSSLRFETKTGKQADPPELQANQINVVFSSGLFSKKIQPLFGEMFNKQAEMVSGNDDDESSISDQGPNLDIISVDLLENIANSMFEKQDPKVERKSYHRRRTMSNDVQELINVTGDASPKKNVTEFDQQLVKTSSEPNRAAQQRKSPVSSILKIQSTDHEDNESVSTVKVKKGTNAERNPLKPLKNEEVFDLNSNEGPEKKATNIDHQIQTTAGEHELPTEKKPAKRTQKRKAAQKATENITKNISEYDYPFESNDPSFKPKVRKSVAASKTPRKTKSKTSAAAPVVLNTIKKEGPKQKRKLFNESDLVEIDVSEKEPKRKFTRNENDELTSTSFRSSFNADTKKQNQRVFANLDKINESVAANNDRTNASFSYRQLFNGRGSNEIAPDLTRVPDVFQGAITHFDNSNDVNVDFNANEKLCICDKLRSKTIKDVKTIFKITKRVLTDLDPNSIKCKCGMVTEEDSS